MLASQGVDPLALPFDRFLNTIYWWLVKDAAEDEVTKFNTRLWIPPKGAVPPPGSPWSAEAETKAFNDFSAAFKGM